MDKREMGEKIGFRPSLVQAAAKANRTANTTKRSMVDFIFRDGSVEGSGQAAGPENNW
jgi:hypothetical protein